MRSVIKQTADGAYDFIVLDMPPVSDTSLAVRMPGMIHAAVLVIEAEKVNEEIACRARDLLLREKINLAGLVLNRRRNYVPKWLHQMV